MIYLQLIWTFFWIGSISFGGGFAMLPLFERTFVPKWLSQTQFLDILAISQATPGAFAINMATYVGALMAPVAWLGAWLSTISLALAGFGLSYFLAYPALKAKEHPFIIILMKYLMPTTLGLISYAGLNLLLSELTNEANLGFINSKSLVYMLFVAVMLYGKFVKPSKLIFIMAAIGAVVTYFYP